jgi:hypothetical protein
METGLYIDNFSKAFNQLLEKGNISCYKISQFSYLDQGYLSRLRKGTQSPSPETVMKISLALTHLSDKINIYDIEYLFKSVGRSIRINRVLGLS